MNRIFRLVLNSLAMLAVALISALLTMRVAIHGSEADVPNLTGLTIPEASYQARRQGLELKLENRFYSLDTAAGHILSQSPAAGTRVRRDWQVRITESLGAQKVDIPNVVGQDESEATVNLRRLSLDLGTVAHFAAPGASDIVLAQTPPPNAAGVDRPRVSLLLSEPETPAGVEALVTPLLTGLNASAAIARASASGLHVAYAEPTAAQPTPAADSTAKPGTASAAALAVAIPAAAGGIVVAQLPTAGHRIQRGETVRITLGHEAAATPAP
jgi:eukaryotic-like serine/threonine-protein kinase